MDNSFDPHPLETESTSPRKDTIVFKRSVFFAALLPIAFVLGLAAGFIFWGLPGVVASSQQPAAQAQVAAPTQASTPYESAPQSSATAAPTQQQIRRYNVPVDDDPSIGPSDAAITLIEFSDFECPYCRQWQTQTWPKLAEDFKGKIRLVYRDFPLDSIHANAVPAAEAADCANEQGKYWEFHDKLFSGQKLSSALFEQYAAEIGLDTAKFKECVSTRKYQKEVQGDIDFASNLGIQSTPTFFINGLPMVGAQPYEVFKQVIEKELAGEFPK